MGKIFRLITAPLVLVAVNTVFANEAVARTHLFGTLCLLLLRDRSLLKVYSGCVVLA